MTRRAPGEREPAGTRRRRWASALGLLLMAAVGLWLCEADELEPLSAPWSAPAHPPLAPPPRRVARQPSTPALIRLEPVASGFPEPTDIQFPPGRTDLVIVLERAGTASWLALPDGQRGKLFHVQVRTAGEEGLLGLAFHPRFADNGKLYVDYVYRKGTHDVSKIAEWTVAEPGRFPHGALRETATLIEVEQPFTNHKAGQLAFGPDGDLYVGFGDGGSRDDPYGNAQNPSTRLGSMLRIDVDHPDPGRSYGVPADNPFVGKPGHLPELWAYGVRNPWRYSFDPSGRLIVADVGQDRWEEISIVAAGDNLGWNVKEGFECTNRKPRCGDPSFVDPVFVYGHDVGQSITGGYVYTGSSLPWLRGRYVFADFIQGKLMALSLPAQRTQRVSSATTLGHWSILPSAFGRDAAGELYVADFAKGELLRIAPLTAAASPR